MDSTLDDIKKEYVSHWFLKIKNEDGNVFDNFLFLWVSFNAFYSKKVMYVKSPLGDEKTMEQNISENDGYKKIFIDIVKNKPSLFQEFLNYINNEERGRDYISDLRFSNPEQVEDKAKYKNLENLQEYLGCIYQIRCNLFHGSKTFDDSADVKLVTLAYNSLYVFLNDIYLIEDILSQSRVSN